MPPTLKLLARQLFTTCPQLTGLRFPHDWCGALDTCMRFRAFDGTSQGGAVAYALSYAGPGVGATRFAAYLGIQASRAALASADRHGGRRNLWLRTLDRLGLGFDS